MTFSRRSFVMADRKRMMLFRIAAVAVATLALPATAQNSTQPPTVITVPQRPFDLQPSNPQATPTPTPPPSPTPIAAPPPVTPTLPTATPTSRASSAPARRAPPAMPEATPTPLTSPTVALPTPEPTPAPIAPAATPTPAAPAPSAGYGPWPWLLAALVLAALAYFGWRKLTAVREPDVDDYAAAPTPTPQPPPPAARAPAPTAVTALAVDFHPTSFRTQGPDAYVAFELTIANPTERRIDAIRTLVALTTAGPDVAQQVAAFNAGASLSPASAPFDLAPGASERLAGELLLSGDAMYVTEVGERALIVPVALVNLRWREGLSLRNRGESWMIGTGAAGAAKLGPVRVDRGSQVQTRLAARRFDVPVA